MTAVGYSAARTRLNELRGQRVPNPVLLGGDVHENGWARPADYAELNGAAVAVEQGTSISTHRARQRAVR
jgi:phosphodiesterase/alkaline phosphatase D-like protein